jgi:hypothetical protein
MNNSITLEEFKNLLKMLNASQDDFDLAVETIRNMDLHVEFLVLIAKCMSLDKRVQFTKDFKNKEDILFETGIRLRLMDYYRRVRECKNLPENFKECFEHYVTKYVFPLWVPTNTINKGFIEDLSIKFNW